MRYPLDAPKAQYVFIRDDEFEPSVEFFITEQAAREYAAKTYPGLHPDDVIIAKLVPNGQ